MRIAQLLIVILIPVLLLGCVHQSADLIHLQTEQDMLADSPAPNTTEQSTPEPTPTPEPLVLQIPEVTGVAFPNDALGIPVVDPATHYSDYYVRYSQLRVYEVEDSTFVDALAENSFSAPLRGGARIVFTGTDGKEYGYGELLTADGSLTLNVGKNYVYAEVLTEVDVQMMDVSIMVTTPFAPVETDD